MYNEQILLDSFEKALSEINVAEYNEETKLKALDALNSILYPLKENLLISDYQFVTKTNETDITIEVFVQETGKDTFETWSIILNKTED